MIKAVVFDLDDTLYPELDYVFSGFKAVAEYIEEKSSLENTFNILIALFNENKVKIFDRFLEFNDIGLNPFDLHKIYINHLPAIKLYDDVLPCLNMLKQLDYKLGIITDGRLVQQKNKVEALNVRNCFDYIVFSDELGIEYRKPHQKPFERIKSDLRVEYSEMIYIGDNPQKDFYISKLYPIKTVQILRQGLYSGDYFGGIEPDFIISSLTELNNILLSWKKIV